MKIKFGALVVDGRGKIGGHVASKNRAGAYLRTKVTPVNAQTSFQLAVRSRFTGFSQGWRALTAANRDAWNAAVADFAKTDVFGDLKNPTGFNLFQRLNNNLSIVGVAQIDTPPLPAAVGICTITAVAIAAGAGSLSATLSNIVPANTNCKIYATAPVSAGKSYVKSLYRLIAVLSAAEATPYNLAAEYIAKFGSVGLAGQKIFVKCEAVNITTGQVGTPSQASGITAA